MATLWEWVIIDPIGRRTVVWAYTRNAAIAKYSRANRTPEDYIREKCKIVRRKRAGWD
ncbi:MAG: hypothetical protein IKK34_07020 [Clostridia bacterium]|nr:hypothetical protein [Clostridia bacterium]